MGSTLLVLAAGMASRYGSLKQMDKFGPSGESIIDYSIYDAIEAGFTKVVFIIRKEFEPEFKSIFEPRLKGRIEIEYAYQQLESYTDGITIPAERTKPWGTAHAILCAKEVVKEPFAVINADDFYGRDAFKKAYSFLHNEASDNLWANICYELQNTLSEFGSVSRGVCKTDEDSFITSVTERTKVYKKDDAILFEEDGAVEPLDPLTKVSMNFWCFSTVFFEFAQHLFHDFLIEYKHLPKSEFFIPFVGDEFIRQQKGSVKAITTSAQWFGATYKEDKPIVQSSIDKLVKENVYPVSL